MGKSRLDNETTFYREEPYALSSPLIARLDQLAAERLSNLAPLSFDELARSEPEAVEMRGPWGARGRLRTEVKEVEENNLRVKVLWDVRFWWWMGYYWAYAGFYRDRHGDSTAAVEAFAHL